MAELATPITKEEYLRRQAENPPDPPTPTKPAKARVCRCGKPLLPPRTVWCSDECSKENDRQRARRRAKKPKAAPILATPPPVENPPPPAARNGAKRDGIATLIAELLAVPDVEVELHVNGAAVLVRKATR